MKSLKIVSKYLQSEIVDPLSAHELLGNALLKLIKTRYRFVELVSEVSDICKSWGISESAKKHCDELCEDERLQESEYSFRTIVFYPVVDTLCTQLDNRFQGKKYVLDTN
ncbi:hypothetical protein PR048_002318 [Dryococelus australis]|uniref:Uncharacterized protein n=1 Tax=Dryococelus australis TaxID=614101 RepID=A0ABQ9IJV5_9NEOP|nr:hypothetical protein PR048_002318 [Dryococelus australis]